MAGRSSSPYSGSGLQSWLNTVPLGSLEQLEASAQKESPETNGPTSISASKVTLPESTSGSTSQAISNGPNFIAPDNGGDAVSGTHIQPEAPPVTSTDSLYESAPQPFAAADAASEPSLHSTTPRSSAISGGRPLDTDSAPELHIPLPDSTSDSGETDERLSSDTGADSAVDGNAQNEYTDQIPTNPASAHQGGRAQNARAEPSYWQKVAPLFRCLPHLKGIEPAYGRHKDAGKVTCIDYHSPGSSRTTVVDEFSVGALADLHAITSRLSKLKTPDVRGITTRVILVEDLCPSLIAALGSTFEMDPEIFAEHLNRAGYHKADYNKAPPDRWDTHNMPKSHVSMTWFRPVYQIPKMTEWTSHPADLLNKYTIKGKSRSKTFPSKIFWLDPELDSRGRLKEHRFRHSIMVNTNIFRRSWPMSTRTFAQDARSKRNDQDDEHDESSLEDESLLSDGIDGPLLHNLHEQRNDLILTAWEEKATFFRYNESTAPIIILLLDPLPVIVDIKTPIDKRRKNADQHLSPLHEERRVYQPTELSLPATSRAAPELPANKFAATQEDIWNFERATSIVISTADAIQQQTVLQDPIASLFCVVQQDHKAFSQHVGWALDEIGQDSLDDYILTRQLPRWRQLITDLEIEIPAVGQSLQKFADFALRGQQGSDVLDIVDSVGEDISRIKIRLDDAYTGLRADMQFTESRRSITEAKTVTKLTELAFLFIPLSFASSLFSMSIQELQNGVPVWTFIVTACGLAVLSYGLRIIIASDFVADSSRAALEKFWERRNLRRGANAPALTLLLLTLKEVWLKIGGPFVTRGSLFLFFSSFVVVPLAFIWTSTSLGAGFNVAMTLFLLLSGLGVPLFCVAMSRMMRFDINQGYNSSGESV